MIEAWPERPRLAAVQMMVKYGAPQELTARHAIWHEAGPYKRIVLTTAEVPHDFPKPHMDFLQHTVAYRVPAGKADALYEFDGAVTIDRNAGELSARCDLESHNILALNLANEIITGKKDASSARKAFAQAIIDDTMGKNPPLLAALQFEPSKGPVGDTDKTSIPGASQRPQTEGKMSANEKNSAGDAEVLGFIVALNDNEIGAAAEAQNKNVNPEVTAYAKMLHQAHGQNQADTMKLGQKIKTTPIETTAVDQFRVKGAGELATLVALEGEKFGGAYIQAMVKGHQEAIAMIDGKLMPMARDDRLKQHLTETRVHIAHHLEAAQLLQTGSKTASSR